MNDDLETTVTLRMVYDAVLALVNESQAQRAQWQEAETNLLMQASLHRARLDEQQVAIEEVRFEIEKEADERDREITAMRSRFQDLKNKLTPLFADVEDVKRRVAELETMARKDTAILPPPPDAEPSG